MKDNVRPIAMGVFVVLVLGGIGFLLMQDDGGLPEAVPDTPRRSGATEAGDDALAGSGGSTTPDSRNAVSRPATATQPAETSGDDAEAETGGPDEPGSESPRPKAKRPRGPGLVKGIVTWHGDGAPVSGATILLDYIERPHSYDPYPEERTQWTAHSDGKGEFRIANLPVNAVGGGGGGRISVTASKDGASAVTTAGLTDDETQALVELVLRPSGGIGGQVLDGAGSPIRGAIVSPQEMADKGQQQYAYGARNLWAATDRDGRFQLDNLNVGAWKLSVQAADFADVVTEAFKTGETNAKIVLKRGATVTGTVINAKGGDPVPGVFVTINAQGNYRSQQRVGTDTEGVFLAASLANGEYQILLDDEVRVLVGEAPKFSIANEKPVEGITMTVIDGGSISGMVTDAETGAPIEGIRIQAQGNQRSAGRNLEDASDITGFYQITGVPGGSYTLRRRWKEGYLHGESRENKAVSLALGEALENIDFAVRRGLSVSGIVVDKAGDPVQGVNVSCNPVVDNGEGEDVTTTEDGVFAVRGFSPNVDFTIQVSGRGYTAPRLGPMSTGDTGVEDLKIVVEAGASVAGVVVDKTGKPMPEIYVSASSPEGGSNRTESTGPAGEFLMKSLEEGAYHLVARRQNSWSSNQQGGLDITLSKGQALTGVRLVFDGGTGSTITGRVTNANREPVKDASVQAYSPAGGSNAYVQTGEDGKYELGVDEGKSYSMHVYHQSYTGQQREGVAAGERNVDFVLEGRGTVEGQVLDARTGRPIPNFEITHSRGLSNQINYQMGNYTAFYNEEGRFSINTVEAGEATIYARATGYAPGIQQVPYVQADAVTGGVQFRLEPGASIEGVVLDMQGAPIQSAQIFLTGRVEPWMLNQGSGYGAVATTDAEGRFAVNSLGEDLTKITAVHPDFPNTTVEMNIAPGETLQIEIVMTGGGTVEGTVYANGVPSANQNVYIQSTGGSGGNSATTDANGFYTVPNIASGEVVVHAQVTRDGATKSQSKTAVVEGGFTTTVDLSVDFGTGAIEGKVTMGGQPVTEGMVVAVLQGAEVTEQQNIQGRIASDGSYAVSGLSAGAYKIMVHVVDPGSGQRRARMVDAAVEDGQTLYLDIDLDGGSHVRGTVSGVSDTNRCQVVAITGAFQINNIATDFMSLEIQSRAAGFSGVDAAGAYDLGGLPAGDYTVVALQIGPNGLDGATYASGQVTVGASGAVELNLALR